MLLARLLNFISLIRQTPLYVIVSFLSSVLTYSSSSLEEFWAEQQEAMTTTEWFDSAKKEKKKKKTKKGEANIDILSLQLSKHVLQALEEKTNKDMHSLMGIICRCTASQYAKLSSLLVELISDLDSSFH